MTAVSLLFLLLLAMASFLVYRAAQHITGRFFRLTRAAFQAVCISCAAVFFAAACAGGLISLHALRGAEYARGVADARDAADAEQTADAEKQRAASAASWQEGYGAGFAAGFSAARTENGTDDMQTEAPPPDGQERVPPQTDGALTDGIPPSDDTTDGGADHPGFGAGGDDTSDEGDASAPGQDLTEPSGDSAGTSEGEAPGVIPTGTTVYYTAGGSVLHRDRNCSYLKRAKEVLSCDASEAPGLPPCSRCG